MTVINSVFTGNKAELWEGPLPAEKSEATLINCTFTGNKADEGTAIGRDPQVHQNRDQRLQLDPVGSGKGSASCSGIGGIFVIYSDVFQETDFGPALGGSGPTSTI